MQKLGRVFAAALTAGLMVLAGMGSPAWGGPVAILDYDASVLDGTPGIVWAGLSSFHTWTKYVRLRELDSGKGDAA